MSMEDLLHEREQEAAEAEREPGKVRAVLCVGDNEEPWAAVLTDDEVRNLTREQLLQAVSCCSLVERLDDDGGRTGKFEPYDSCGNCDRGDEFFYVEPDENGCFPTYFERDED